MLQSILKFIVILIPLIDFTLGFWWATESTTKAPVVAQMKQIPLTYFRTYTYQPLSPGRALPFPLLSSTDYLTNYGAMANTQYFNPFMSLMSGASSTPTAGASMQPTANGIDRNDVVMSRPAKSFVSANALRSLNDGNKLKPKARTTSTTTSTSTEPTTTTASTTTTTTTTTTPAPTTTASTTTTAKPTKSAEESADVTYPTFNRKVFTNHFNINYNRPIYPYPEYSTYKNPANDEKTKAAAQIQKQQWQNQQQQQQASLPNIEFVPCMCPVNVQTGYQNGLPIVGNPSNSIFLAQSRSNQDADSAMDLPMSEQLAPVYVPAAEKDFSLSAEHADVEGALSAVSSSEDLQILKLDDDADDDDVEVKLDNLESATQAVK